MKRFTESIKSFILMTSEWPCGHSTLLPHGKRYLTPRVLNCISHPLVI